MKWLVCNERDKRIALHAQGVKEQQVDAILRELGDRPLTVESSQRLFELLRRSAKKRRELGRRRR